MNDIDFTGKIVSFGYGTTDGTLAMKFIRFAYQHDRLFALGVIPRGATTNDWAIERPCAIAWDSVTDYMVFDSEEQYVELLDKS